MINLESRRGTAHGNSAQVFNYISDFRNFARLLPEEKLNDIAITEKTIRFEIQGLGEIGLEIAESHPNTSIVVKPVEGSSTDFTISISIAEKTPETSDVVVHLVANLNMFIEMMAKPPLQKFLDLMMDKVETIDFR
jgi:carbon monoxide dehydrogenase subunit G